MDGRYDKLLVPLAMVGGSGAVLGESAALRRHVAAP